MKISEILKSERSKRNLTQRGLALKSNISNATISRIESGDVIPDTETLEKLSRALSLDINYLIGNIDASIFSQAPTPTAPGSKWIPVYGDIAGGTPIEMIEDIVDWEEIDAETVSRGEIFALRVKGNSMEPKISDGDVVIIRQQPTVENGEIAAVAINGDSATLKRVQKTPQGIMLVATNPAYEPLFFSNAEIDEKPIRILGKMIELRAKF